MVLIPLPTLWQCKIENGKPEGKMDGVIRIPGTLDESGIGFEETQARPWHPDARIEKSKDKGITTRFIRKVTFEGKARLQTDFLWSLPDGCRVFLEIERARCLSLRVNGQTVPEYTPFSLSAPQIFEVTSCVRGFDHFEIDSDNSYPGLDHDDIVFSSAATDETQTNWNGLLGYCRLRLENPVFMEQVRVYPHKDSADVCIRLSTDRPWKGRIRLFSEAFCEPASADADVPCGRTEVWKRGIPYAGDVKRWDLDEGNLYTLTAAADGLDTLTARFGIRVFSACEGMFTLNDRVIFVRSEANCAVFPETGYAPMDVASWMDVLGTYKSYGVNMMRFHSHVPPQAAFEAADRTGMLMQPELPCWNPRNAFETESSASFYAQELKSVLDCLANHPSFVMLTFGNELQAGEKGHRQMDAMLDLAREKDPTRLYANASNPHYGALGCDPRSDFYTSSGFGDFPLRGAFAGMTGKICDAYPSEDWDYKAGMAALRETYKGPVLAFEVGQFEILPDPGEIALFQGITRPDNLSVIDAKARRMYGADAWARRFRATAALSRICYRAEVEANMRTQTLAGISMLGLQDFPGQGTALVGMLNSHLRPKPSEDTQPAAFQAFFRDVLPLVLLKKYTYEAGETLRAKVQVANYGKSDLNGRLTWELLGGERHGAGKETVAVQGAVTDVGEICVAMPETGRNSQYTLKVAFAGYENVYPLWVYLPLRPVCPENVYETRVFDDTARDVLAGGGRVYLSPPSDEKGMPGSVRTYFSTDFWSVGTFPQQSGTMGQLIDESHPVFRHFPTDFHTDWQWWPMASSRALILPESFEGREIISEMDSYARMRRMAQLFETRCGGGLLMVSSMGLQDLQMYPEARALLGALYTYMEGPEFQPEGETDPEEIARLFR